MPRQSRGFWFCDYCHSSFDRFEETQAHELEECRQNPNRYQGGAVGRSPSQMTPSYYYPHPIQSPQVLPQQQSMTMPPYSPNEKLQQYRNYPGTDLGQMASPYGPPPVVAGKSHSSSRGLRQLPLMEKDITSHLSPANTVACQNVEFFETSVSASSQDTTGYDNRASLTSTQLGIRCIACGNSDRSSGTSQDPTRDELAAATEVSLPRSVESLSDAVCRIAERHLSHCTRLSQEERKILNEVFTKGDESAGDQANQAWQGGENNRRMLHDFCLARCHQLGIINKQPENSGIMFRSAVAGGGSYHQCGDVRGRPADPPPLFDSQQSQFRYASDMYGGSPIHPHHVPSSGPPYHMSARGDARGQTSTLRQSYTTDAMGNMPTPMPGGPQQDRAHVSSVGAHEVAEPFVFHQSTSQIYDLPSHFPFFQDAISGDWLCKYCVHLPPSHRGPNFQYVSASRAPPPGDFIDSHLVRCRSYRQANPHALDYPVGHPPSPAMPFPYGQAQTMPPGWDNRGGGRGVPSAIGLSPVPLNEFPPIHPTAVANAPPMPTPSSQTYRTEPASLHSGVHEPVKKTSSVLRAIELLTARDDQSGQGSVEIDQPLVLDEDKLLLTDFLYFLMKQLRLVRFSEADRKTRGGKREKIQIGFGGLECIHCSHIPKPRKFFWSGVDRLANSFAEIPGHIFKCKYCSDEVKQALTDLKKIHPDQMARLPRGSQKVFFRRVWKRLHEGDPPESPSNEESPPKPPPGQSSSPGDESTITGKQHSPEGTSGSEESIFLIQRPTKEAAKALADSAMQSGPPSPSSRVLLAIAEDRDFLSDTDCFIRKQLEVFCATAEDIALAEQDRKFKVFEGQVGIRCIHCSLAKRGGGPRGHAVAYPFSINGIFEAVREFQRLHLDYCQNLSPLVRSKIVSLQESAATITSIQRRYYALAAKGLGLRDSNRGIRAGSESVPVVSQAVFTFSEHNVTHGDGNTPPSARTSPSEFATPIESRKRRPHHDDEDTPHSKRHTPDARQDS